MAWDDRNLADTVHARVTYQTLRCEVGSKPSEWSAYLDWNWAHRWRNPLREGRCMNCGKTLKEVRVRINPKTGEPIVKASRMAREIALTPADVPPVRFVGR